MCVTVCVILYNMASSCVSAISALQPLDNSPQLFLGSGLILLIHTSKKPCYI